MIIRRVYTSEGGGGGGGGGSGSHMKGAGMLVGNLELNQKRSPVWAWPNLFLTPKRDHFKL